MSATKEQVHEAAIALFEQVSDKRDYVGYFSYGATVFACGYCDEHQVLEYRFGPRGEPSILSGTAHSIEELENVVQAIVTMENIAYDMIRSQGVSVGSLSFDIKRVSAA